MKDNTEYCISAEVKYARRRFPSNKMLLAALMEEVGELANALIEHEVGDGKCQDVYNEAIQVAAMAIRIAEEGDGVFKYKYSDNLYRGFPIKPPRFDVHGNLLPEV